jgi:glutathione S-transferase
MPTPALHFYYAPQSRARSTLALFEELGLQPEITVLNLKTGQQREPAYLAVNPMGKVPAITCDGVLVTEQPAIFMFLADRFPAAGLAPALDDPLRGAYLRWMVFYGSCFEPAVVDHAMRREPLPPSTSPYDTYGKVLAQIDDALKKGPYLLGERLTAADLLWGPALDWTTMFGIVPKTPVIEAYIERIKARPAQQRAAAREAEYVKSQS